MPIAREGEFLLTHDLTPSTSIGLESAQLQACIQEAKRRGYRSVFGSPDFGFHEDSLDALAYLPDLEFIWFWEVELKNVDALYGLTQLKRFGVHHQRPAIDFSRLPSLRGMVWMPRTKDRGVDTLSLDWLNVWHYNPKSRHFADLDLPSTLQALDISWANPASVDGLRSIPGLRRLELHRCRNLADLKALPELYPSLEFLLVDACGRVRPEEALAVVKQMPNLTHACVQGKLLVTSAD